MNIRQEVKDIEIRRMQEMLEENNHFVKFSYSSEYAFKRFEAIKLATKIVEDAVRATGGDMPKELLDAYEGWNNIGNKIKEVELDVIKVGR
jgi:hypothetical protein